MPPPCVAAGREGLFLTKVKLSQSTSETVSRALGRAPTRSARNTGYSPRCLATLVTARRSDRRLVFSSSVCTGDFCDGSDGHARPTAQRLVRQPMRQQKFWMSTCRAAEKKCSWRHSKPATSAKAASAATSTPPTTATATAAARRRAATARWRPRAGQLWRRSCSACERSQSESPAVPAARAAAKAATAATTTAAGRAATRTDDF